ncbi:cell division protein FtsH [Enterobacter asburiae]|uniref:Cell division protein FtsH n=1 Tax=Enterobacter asburiae TaxID=61645 RepID=A0A376FJA4_ENTAS|nr:cell division protein FtsH [Enterobacter asburiae]
MAWNQPGNNGQDRDPWGSSKPGGNSEGNGNKGGREQGPPDLDDIFRKLSKKLGGLGGGKGSGSGGNSTQEFAPANGWPRSGHRGRCGSHHLGSQRVLHH